MKNVDDNLNSEKLNVKEIGMNLALRMDTILIPTVIFNG